MQYFLKVIGLIIVGFVIPCSAFADHHERNVAGKLTASQKPQVRVMTDHERTAAAENMLALDLDVSPDEVVCRKVKVGRDSASRLKVNRCKTRAAFRLEFEQRLNESGLMFDKEKMTYEFRRLGGLQNRRPVTRQKPGK